jgi:hypothetical protein
MSKKSGQLLWSRQIIVVSPTPEQGPNPISNIVNTHLTQVNRGFNNSSINEPTLGSNALTPSVLATPLAPPVPPVPPLDLLPSRIQVIPVAYGTGLDDWQFLTHNDAFFDPTTQTCWVEFENSDPENSHTVTVLFWDPHSIVGPGEIVIPLG